MKTPFFALLVALSTAIAAPALAAETAKEARAEHYEAAVKPKNAAEAFAVLSNNEAPLQNFLKAGDLEKIHETSYTLEAALSVLNKEASSKERKEILKKVVATVDVIHEGSEDGKTAEVSKALLDYKAQLPQLKAAYKL